jgi:arsenate reductase-like glutaredoxin family protein
LAAWCQQVGWEILLNKKSTTWRSLPIATQQQLTGEAAAIELMQQNTSLIKRPVIELNDRVMVGFNEANFNELFN